MTWLDSAPDEACSSFATGSSDGTVIIWNIEQVNIALVQKRAAFISQRYPIQDEPVSRLEADGSSIIAITTCRTATHMFLVAATAKSKAFIFRSSIPDGPASFAALEPIAFKHHFAQSLALIPLIDEKGKKLGIKASTCSRSREHVRLNDTRLCCQVPCSWQQV